MPSNAPTFLIIGGANIDITGHACTPPEIIADSHPGTITSHHGGVARNIAENLARLDCQIRLISTFGDCQNSHALKDKLAGLDIMLTECLTVANHSADCYLSLHHPDGELISAINQMPLIDRLDSRFLKTKEAAITQADIIIIDANLPADSIAMIAEMKSEKQLLCGDCVSAHKAMRFAPYLDAFDMLKGNFDEACTLADMPATTSLNKLADTFLAKGLSHILLSHGSSGFCYGNKDETINQPALEAVAFTQSVNMIRAENATLSGAGDALLAGALFALSNQQPPAIIAMMAAKAAYYATLSQAPVNPFLTKEHLTE